MKIKKVNEMKTEDIYDISTSQASPTPWSFEWEEYPVIKDKNGKVVATLSTGEVSGAYSEEQIMANAKMILFFQPISRFDQ